MNKKVLKTMIALVVVFLVACYILKIFFPQQFVMSVENDTIINIGNYIDSHKWLYYIFGSCTSFLTYWLYCCACCRRWRLNWWQCLVILGVVAASLLLTFVDVNLTAILNYTSFVFLPYIFKSDLKAVCICYTIHVTNQFLTTSIRNILAYISVFNTLNIMILSIDMFLWLGLLYLLFNFKKKEI